MINNLETPKAQKDNIEEPHMQKMDLIVAKAQASINKLILSPFAKQGHMPNDSLDGMRLEFMADY